ncbi:hypothetical protein Tco_1176943 [Tanacetum coccineum]
MMLLAKAITQQYFTPTNNCLHASSNTHNQVYVQDGCVNVQSKNVGNAGNAGRNTGRVVGNSRNATYGQQANENDFLLVDVPDSEELEELNETCIMMARLQSVNNDTNAGPFYDSDFAKVVNDSQTSFINDMFAKGDHEQFYLEQAEYIKATYDDDQIDSKIIFDDPDVKNVQLEAEKTNKINKVVKEQGYENPYLCNTPKSGLQRNVEYPRALLHRSIAQDMRTTTKRVV